MDSTNGLQLYLVKLCAPEWTVVFLKARWPLFLDLLYRENICKCSDIANFLSLIWLSKVSHYEYLGLSCTLLKSTQVCKYSKTWKRLKSGPLRTACISDKGHTAQCPTDKKCGGGRRQDQDVVPIDKLLQSSLPCQIGLPWLSHCWC